MAPHDDFGKLLFARRYDRPAVWYLAAGSTIIWPTAWLFLRAFWPLDGLLLLSLIPIALLLYAWQRSRCRVDCYERGVVTTAFGRTRRLAFADVARMTVQVLKFYDRFRGEHIPSHWRFVLAPDVTARKRSQRVRFVFDASTGDLDLQQLTATLATHAANHLAALLAQTGSAAWADNVHFVPDALEVRQPMVKSRFPLASLTGVDFTGDALRLYFDRESRARILLFSVMPGFWPGLVLLDRLTRHRYPQLAPRQTRIAEQG